MPAKRTNGSGHFSKGTSGNPAGQPLGSRNHATLLMESLLEGEAEQLTRKAIELALAGDITALLLCLERLIPPRKDRPIHLILPQSKTYSRSRLRWRGWPRKGRLTRNALCTCFSPVLYRQWLAHPAKKKAPVPHRPVKTAGNIRQRSCGPCICFGQKRWPRCAC